MIGNSTASLIASRALSLYQQCFSSDLHSSRSIAAVKSKRQTFPMILMALLEDPANTNILTWLPNGTSFAIICQKQFTTELMPNHLNVKTFHAFTRKLGQWGFCRRDKHSFFYHPLFRQGNWLACGNIRCQTSSGRKMLPKSSYISSPTQSGAILLRKPDCAKQSVELYRAAIRTQEAQPVAPVLALQKSQMSTHCPRSQTMMNILTKAVVGAAVDALLWDRSSRPSLHQSIRRPHHFLSYNLAARTSELKATSACRGKTGMAKEKIKAELLSQVSSSERSREFTEILRKNGWQISNSSKLAQPAGPL